MRAAVLTAPNTVEIVSDWPEPTAARGDVVVEVSGVGICGTDLAYVSGIRAIPAGGLVVGHEPWGVIVAVGEGVDPARVGERVAVEPNYGCGACAPCERGETSLCTARRSPVVTEHGFLAERVAVPATHAWPLPAGISDADASCIEPLAVAMAAIRRAGDLHARPRIAIMGAGSIGRILADVLLRRGVTPAVLDLSAERVALAVAQGARAAAPGDEFDLVFESSGAGRAGSVALTLLAPAGLLVVIGVGNEPIQVETTTLVRRGLTVVGSMIYDHPSDYAAVIDAVAAGRARPGVVLGTPHPLHEAGAALAAASSADTKTWIRMSGGADCD